MIHRWRKNSTWLRSLRIREGLIANLHRGHQRFLSTRDTKLLAVRDSLEKTFKTHIWDQKMQFRLITFWGWIDEVNRLSISTRKMLLREWGLEIIYKQAIWSEELTLRSLKLKKFRELGILETDRQFLANLKALAGIMLRAVTIHLLWPLAQISNQDFQNPSWICQKIYESIPTW